MTREEEMAWTAWLDSEDARLELERDFAKRVMDVVRRELHVRTAYAEGAAMVYYSPAPNYGAERALYRKVNFS